MKYVHGELYRNYIIESAVAVLFPGHVELIVMKLCKNI
jgi:hypothetical protein